MGDKFYTYLLQSQVDQSFYIGQTKDLEQRLILHNEGHSKSTMAKRPWKIVYFEVFDTRSEAIKRERFLGKDNNSKIYTSFISQSLANTEKEISFHFNSFSPSIFDHMKKEV